MSRLEEWYNDTFKGNYCPFCKRHVQPKKDWIMIIAVFIGILVLPSLYPIIVSYLPLIERIGTFYIFYFILIPVFIFLLIVPGWKCPICGCNKMKYKEFYPKK